MLTSSSSLTSAIVLVEVSEEPTMRVNSVHKSTLEKCSLYFQKCLASGMIETQQKRVCLHDVQPAAFDTAAYWMYKAALRANLKFDSWHEIYSLADRLCMDQMMNAILDYQNRLFESMLCVAGNLQMRCPHVARIAKSSSTTLIDRRITWSSRGIEISVSFRLSMWRSWSDY
jgi:hypothetical protein